MQLTCKQVLNYYIESARFISLGFRKCLSVQETCLLDVPIPIWSSLRNPSYPYFFIILQVIWLIILLSVLYNLFSTLNHHFHIFSLSIRLAFIAFHNKCLGKCVQNTKLPKVHSIFIYAPSKTYYITTFMILNPSV